MLAVDVIVEEESWTQLAGKAVLAERAVAAAAAELPNARAGVIAILLTDDASVASMNEQFRGKTGPTNVLSFPAAANVENHLGDIALAWGVVECEAANKSCSVADHLRHLIIHGFLHLQGYDHQADEEAEIMEAIECRALSRLGVANPYTMNTDDEDGNDVAKPDTQEPGRA
ncbi:MAG: rRNA maturation RNase YbeY [Maricaulis sp.]|jgi:probable rRNA maturation factor|nr:rRNA maturation RNase YbeY [Maricaulis sp.]MDG2043266.1 rRNA maturation RNase YbeY [Maricaulis sp.]